MSDGDVQALYFAPDFDSLSKSLTLIEVDESLIEEIKQGTVFIKGAVLSSLLASRRCLLFFFGAFFFLSRPQAARRRRRCCARPRPRSGCGGPEERLAARACGGEGQAARCPPGTFPRSSWWLPSEGVRQ